MKCPVCGLEIQNGKAKCLRCGYEFKELIIQKQQQNKQSEQNPQDEYKEIDPKKVFMGQSSNGGSFFGGGSFFDQIFGGRGGGGVFSEGIFGGFSNIIDDIFGGMFGSSQNIYSEGDYGNDYVDEFGRPLQIDVFETDDYIEVADIEVYDENGNLIEDKSSKKRKRWGRK